MDYEQLIDHRKNEGRRNKISKSFLERNKWKKFIEGYNDTSDKSLDSIVDTEGNFSAVVA